MITTNRHTNGAGNPWNPPPPASAAPTAGSASGLGAALHQSLHSVQHTLAGIPGVYLASAFAAGLVVGWITKQKT